MDNKSRIVDIEGEMGQSEYSKRFWNKIWKETKIENDYKKKEQPNCTLSKEKKVMCYER